MSLSTTGINITIASEQVHVRVAPTESGFAFTELADVDQAHIENLVAEGYREGEVFGQTDDGEYYRGWWHLVG